jgi:hypothetical protein
MEPETPPQLSSISLSEWSCAPQGVPGDERPLVGFSIDSLIEVTSGMDVAVENGGRRSEQKNKRPARSRQGAQIDYEVTLDFS